MKREKPAAGKPKQSSLPEAVEAIQNAKCANTTAPLTGMPLITNFRTNMQQIQCLQDEIQQLLRDYESIHDHLEYILEKGKAIKL